MKIILLEDIKKKGKKGEVLSVKDGYAKFLIDDKKAVVATRDNLEKLKRNNQKEEENLHKQIELLTKVKEKLEKEKVEFKVKTGAGDKVFGSVSGKQIATYLNNLGYDISKKQIILEEMLSTLGVHNVSIELHKQVIANIKVSLVK